MQESSRRHGRIAEKPFQGMRFSLDGILPKSIDVFLPEKNLRGDSFLLLLHFHGAPFVVHHAATEFPGNVIATTINLGAGSRVYENGFADSTKFEIILGLIQDSVSARLARRIKIGQVYLTAFSAGYGAVRKILGSPMSYERVNGALLLDGIHTGYIPEHRVLAEGGVIDSMGLEIFLKFAKDAATLGSKKKFLLTHSEIFPGTFVSTTEAADHLIRHLTMQREPVLEWGPLGMQQLSRASKNHFSVLGFAGNAAQDHVDHFHALFFFLRKIKEL